LVPYPGFSCTQISTTLEDVNKFYLLRKTEVFLNVISRPEISIGKYVNGKVSLKVRYFRNVKSYCIVLFNLIIKSQKCSWTPRFRETKRVVTVYVVFSFAICRSKMRLVPEAVVSAVVSENNFIREILSILHGKYRIKVY
jgi:hypothetical protein